MHSRTGGDFLTKLDFLRQPFPGSDIAAFVFAVLALLFLVLWRRDQERGAPWFALTYLLLSAQYAFDATTRPIDQYANPVAAFLFGLAGAAFNCGLVHYLAPQANPGYRALTLCVGPLLLPPLAAIAGVPVSRYWALLCFIVALPVIVRLGAKAARAEPTAGHEWLIGGLLSIPVFATVVIVLGIDSAYLRYYALLPSLFVGMLLLTVSLLRRSRLVEAENLRRQQAERALSAVNDSLEATVARRTADLQSLVAGLESFNRNVSHDLRGSLGGMSGLARVANDALARGDETVARRVLPLIATQAEQSAELVEALLTLARVGDQDVRKVQTDLRTLAREAIASVSLMQANGPLPKFVVSDLPPVLADASLLRPVLNNLIGNAVKFCGYRPGACVEVSGRSDEQHTVVQVRDNGIGFPANSAASRLFQPFSRLHGQEFAGHGVGLSIVRRAVERHGGRVWAESESGKGASFYFSLPNQSIEAMQGVAERAIAAE
jgi:signal transduction histidine kinase